MKVKLVLFGALLTLSGCHDDSRSPLDAALAEGIRFCEARGGVSQVRSALLGPPGVEVTCRDGARLYQGVHDNRGR